MKYHEALDATNLQDGRLIYDAAKRTAEKIGMPLIEVEMRLVHCHAVNKLNLEKLLGFDDGNFFHDISGILRHVNVWNGELEDCFLPRCGLVKAPTLQEAQQQANAIANAEIEIVTKN